MNLILYHELLFYFYFLLIFTPIDLNALSVCKTSSDFKILFISQIPFEIDGIIIDLCDIDLSPGIFGIPFIPFVIDYLSF